MFVYAVGCGLRLCNFPVIGPIISDSGPIDNNCYSFVIGVPVLCGDQASCNLVEICLVLSGPLCECFVPPDALVGQAYRLSKRACQLVWCSLLSSADLRCAFYKHPVRSLALLSNATIAPAHPA